MEIAVSWDKALQSHGIYLQLGIHKTASAVLWAEFLAIDPEVPGSIARATRLSEKSWNRGPHSLARIIEERLERKTGGSSLEKRRNVRRDALH